MGSVLNLDALRNSQVKNDPFPYFTLDHAIKEQDVLEIIRDFPKITDGGSFNLADVNIRPNFDRLLKSVDTPEFRRILTDKFGVNVMHLPMMITLRGYSRQKDGKIHTDSKTKVLTILIYMNESWEHATGRLRVLRDGKDIHNYAEEISAGPGQLIAFKVTDNGWHGYIPYEGQRQSIQINFLTGEGASSKHKFFHGLSAKLKALRRGRQKSNPPASRDTAPHDTM
ncbi:conserved hypothetical protein [gamma proteobacterium HdN1]|nr:conserved hypothetical protein [gamma proteobacterium HdN1]